MGRLLHLHASLLVFCAAWAALSPVLLHHAVYDDVYVLGSPDLHSSWADWLRPDDAGDAMATAMASIPAGRVSAAAILFLPDKHAKRL